MQNVEIIILGAAILDVLARPVDATCLRNSSTPMSDIRMTTGGDALNEAMVLTTLGKTVQLETVLGHDEAGYYIQRQCEKNGICLREECLQENMVTGINIVLVDETGERRFLTNPQSSLRRLSLADIHMPFPESVRIVCLASIFVSPLLGVQEMTELFRQVKKQGKILCADMTKCKNHETVAEMAPALQYLDYLFTNEEEALLLTGGTDIELAAKLLRGTGTGCVVVKAGGKGCYLLQEGNGQWISPRQKTECIDTTGAGDSFAAGFIAALSEGKTPEECADYANVCGGLAVSKVGATSWLEEVAEKRAVSLTPKQLSCEEQRVIGNHFLDRVNH